MLGLAMDSRSREVDLVALFTNNPSQILSCNEIVFSFQVKRSYAYYLTFLGKKEIPTCVTPLTHEFYEGKEGQRSPIQFFVILARPERRIGSF